MDINKNDILLQQIEICKQFNVKPAPPADNQLFVVSEGVFEGDALEGVRYPSPKHMSGWWLTTDKYNGDSKTLRTEHIIHLLEKRPEISKYLALPNGFRFRFNSKAEIWFDEKIAKEEI